MAGLVAGHLVHGVMDRVEIVLLGQLCELELAVGRAVLGVDTHLKILLRAVGDDLTEELGELRSVLGFLVRGPGWAYTRRAELEGNVASGSAVSSGADGVEVDPALAEHRGGRA